MRDLVLIKSTVHTSRIGHKAECCGKELGLHCGGVGKAAQERSDPTFLRRMSLRRTTAHPCEGQRNYQQATSSEAIATCPEMRQNQGKSNRKPKKK